MNRRAIVAGNWKMHHGPAAARRWCRALREAKKAGGPSASDLVVAPPFPSIAAFADESSGLGVRIAAQNCHGEDSGAFTGEVAATMLAEAGCELVIVGHSERRHLLGESDRTIARKVRAVRDAGMTPILCVGETDQQRTSGRTEPIIEAQLRNGLAEIRDDTGAGIVLAYEPVWAIGTGKVATAEQAQNAHHFLRQLLVDVCGSQAADAVRILYGGSVKPGNAASLSAQADVDGFLVGGASLDAADFWAVASAF